MGMRALGPTDDDCHTPQYGPARGAVGPCVVFSLPRSRSAWLSVLLSRPGALVGHDIGISCATPEDFAQRLRNDLAGTCETGAAFAWRLIRWLLPEAPLAVVRRPVGQVIDSLRRQGLYGFDAEMEARAAAVAEIAAQTGVLAIDFADLGDREACAALFEHCTGRPMDTEWFEHMAALNVQLDMPTRLQLLAANAIQIATLKTEVAKRLANA